MTSVDILPRWARIHSRPPAGGRALFLDRDGTIIENSPYLSDPEGVVLLPGAKETIQAFRASAHAVVIVTNQSGIARGLCSEAQYDAVSARLIDLLGPDAITAIFTCPYHPDGIGQFAREHSWRKPSPGMLTEAAALLEIDLASSVMVGDSLSDIEAGVGAGIGRVIHVLTGHGAKQRPGVMAYADDMPRQAGFTRLEFAEAIGEVRPSEFRR